MLPATHVCVPFFPLPQTSWQGAVAPLPQVMLHEVEPVQFTLHPPAGLVTLQPLFPWHVTVEPLPTDSVQLLVPSQLRLLSSPALRAQVLPPPHFEVQLLPHVPEHCDFPLQVEVQPVPQFRPHAFLEEQL